LSLSSDFLVSKFAFQIQLVPLHLGRWLEPWKLVASPAILGTQNLPDPIATYGGQPKPRPILFVGNHSGAGALDLPLLVHELHLRGYCARALAHPAAWFSPLGRGGVGTHSPLGGCCIRLVIHEQIGLSQLNRTKIT
jgi:hypothetical protein